jgi:hypothetical protein
VQVASFVASHTSTAVTALKACLALSVIIQIKSFLHCISTYNNRCSFPHMIMQLFYTTHKINFIKLFSTSSFCSSVVSCEEGNRNENVISSVINMKTQIKKTFAAALLLFAVACSKESIPAPDLPKPDFQIGQPYGGGIIFYLDSTGKHGLIAAATDLPTPVPWCNANYQRTFAVDTGIGTGAENTRLIINALGDTTDYAAKLCRDWRDGGFTDWFLPSIGELNELYNQKDIIGNFDRGRYWSSSDGDGPFNEVAASKVFKSGKVMQSKKYNSYLVRPIRAF